MEVGQQASPEELILEALRARNPLVLVLGQDAWSLSGEPDPVLALALKRLGRTGGNCTWPEIISGEPLPGNFYEWLAERFRRRPIPSWLEAVAKLPWSAIFTSTLDPTVHDVFALTFRQPQVILTAAEVPLAARSTARTPIYYLFGRAGLSDALAMSPRSRSELRVRSIRHAIPMLNRLPETVTALGLVVIDGFLPNRDWLSIEPLLAAVEQTPSGQVIWCGVEPALATSEEIGELVQHGRLLTTPKRLGTIIAELQSSGRLYDVAAPVPSEAGTISFNNGRSCSPRPEVRIRVEAVATIVDDSWSAPLVSNGSEAEYTAFRQFHGDAGGPRALVEGVRRGFAISRDFENRLWLMVKSAIDEHSRVTEPIIIHGQSGAGKTIALARIVARIREDKRAAALYAIGRVPQPADVEPFCELVEQSGGAVTILICDANAPMIRYRDLLLGLRSRGRRIVVIGSTYRQMEQQLPRTCIEASGALSSDEREQLSNLLKRFGDDQAPTSRIGHDSSVLATLYRTLPVSRQRLSIGLGGEARAAERLLRERGAQTQPVAPQSVLAAKLIAAGLAAEDTAVLSDRIDDILTGADDSACRAIDFVMAAGRVNCAVPVNLLMRAIGSETLQLDILLIRQMFHSLDLFRWRWSDADGEDLSVSPRLTLEAELICRRRLISATAEGALLAELLRSARLSWDAGGSERRFVLDLVQKLGPDGPLGNRYKDTYLDAGRALTALRLTYGIDDPSLILQEAVLRRSAIRENVVTQEEKLNILEEAREAVQAGIDHLATQTSRGARRMRANLSVERAAIYGFLATDRAKQSASAEDVWSAYQAARVATRAAVAVSSTYFPLDVSLWIPADLIEFPGLTESQRAELLADIYSVLDRIDPESLPPEQRSHFYVRLFKLGERLRSQELSDAAFVAMETDGSTAGYYLRARSLGPQLQPGGPDEVDVANCQRASNAAAFLTSHLAKIASDDRCLRYLLQCKWVAAVGRRLLHGERSPLPYNDSDRRELLRLVRDLNVLISPVSDNALLYLEAVLAWVTGEQPQAHRLWRDLARDTDFIDPQRVIRRHIVTGPDRLPVMFSGRIEAEQEPGRFTIRVNESGGLIQMLGRDFPDRELAYGRTVTSFCIAFNYIGPIADAPQKSASHQ